MQIPREEHDMHLCTTGHVDRTPDRELANSGVRRGAVRRPPRVRLSKAVGEQRERLIVSANGQLVKMLPDYVHGCWR